MCGINVHWDIICIYFLSLTSFASISVIAPFFPSEATKKGISASLAGGVLSIFGVVLIIANAITGKMLPVVGSKPILSVGIVVIGLSNITFGLLEYIHDSEIFIVLCFIVRAIEAIGVAFLNTTAYVILMKKCCDNASKAIAINESCISIGFAVGPALGSLLYSIGGYKLPFLILGTAVLINIPFSIFVLENYKDCPPSENQLENKQGLSYLKLLSTPKVVVVCLAIFVVGNNFGVIDSTLGLYLESYKISPNNVGFMFMLTAASYTASSLLIGNFFLQSNGFRYLTFGLLLNTLAFLIIGPSPFFVLRGSLMIACFALFVIGTANAFALIPSMPTILLVTAADGYSNNVTNLSYVSGLLTTFYALGNTVGPYFGAALFQYFDSEIMFTVIATINLLCSFISLQPLLNYCKTGGMAQNSYSEIDGVCLK